jgi:protocatechuate 3,4-dioxygenase beta subunit
MNDLDFSRRELMRFLGGAALVSLAGCSSESSSGPDAASPADASGSASADAPPSACATIPEETGGPYPGDGTNGPNALTESGIVRSDIRSSFGSSTTTATGVPLTLTLAIVDQASGCTPLAGRAVYIWHCDRAGNYSMYSAGVTGENYLRGVQVTGADGTVTFTTIFPGCYSGRWPHIHFEVYESAAAATSGQNAIATSQLALPSAACNTIYATSDYASSKTNFASESLATDNVFSDGATLETPVVSGDTSAMTAYLQVAL